jgi:hypothetical protein
MVGCLAQDVMTLPLKAAGAKHRLTNQPHNLSRIDPMPGLTPQLLADRLGNVVGDQHLGQGGRRSGPFGLPQLVNLALLERLTTQVEELVDLLGGRLVTQQINLKGQVDRNR